MVVNVLSTWLYNIMNLDLRVEIVLQVVNGSMISCELIISPAELVGVRRAVYYLKSRVAD